MVGENAWIERRGIQLSTKIQRGCGSYIRQRMAKGSGNFPTYVSMCFVVYNITKAQTKQGGPKRLLVCSKNTFFLNIPAF
jgi:hypothetical protein